MRPTNFITFQELTDFLPAGTALRYARRDIDRVECIVTSPGGLPPWLEDSLKRLCMTETVVVKKTASGCWRILLDECQASFDLIFAPRVTGSPP